MKRKRRILRLFLCFLILLFIPACKTGKAEDKKLRRQAVLKERRSFTSKPEGEEACPDQNVCISQDIGNGTSLSFQIVRKKQQDEAGGGAEILDIKIYRAGEEEFFQELQTDYVEQDADPFLFRDLNADGYLDLIFTEKNSGSDRIVSSYLWSGSGQKFLCGPEELNGYDYYAVRIDRDSHSLRVGGGKGDGYESYTYQWLNETDLELVKAFYDTRTERGVSIYMVSFCDGEEKVLMDCAYDTVQFSYHIDRYFYTGDIFRAFYEDTPVWEKNIPAENPGNTYTLLYAQKVRYENENEDEEAIAHYESHLWVMDEENRIRKLLLWQSETPYVKITWEEQEEKQEEPGLFIQYADGTHKACALSGLLKDPAEEAYEKGMQIDFEVKENSMDTDKYDVATDKLYKDAYFGAISGRDTVRASEEETVYLKEYWHYQGDPLMEDETFLNNLIENARFYYLDFDGDGLPELVMDILCDGLHILKYLPEEETVEIFWGYESCPYFHLLGAGQLYYNNPTLANKDIWEYVMVDAGGQDRCVIYFLEDYDYRPHKEEEEEWWDASYWIGLEEEWGEIQIDEKRYQEITAGFFEAVEHAVTPMTFEEVFGERFLPPRP